MRSTRANLVQRPCAGDIVRLVRGRCEWPLNWIQARVLMQQKRRRRISTTDPDPLYKITCALRAPALFAPALFSGELAVDAR
eukprot:4881581-Pyramimonas_sp.AAC.1